MRAVPRRPILLAAALALVLAACAPDVASFAPEDAGIEGPRFVTLAVDVRENSGVGLGLASSRDGTPNISYLRLNEVERIPTAPIPADPKNLPAVMAAHVDEQGIWTRDIVAQESARGAYEAAVDAAEAAGTDPPERPEFTEENLPPKLAGLSSEDNTDIALDAQGNRHVAWTNGNDAVQYASDEGGGFLNGPEDPLETVAEGDISGVSIAVGDDGSPWIAFYDGAAVTVATRGAEGWVAEAIADGTGAPDGARTDIAIGSSGPFVVFGADGGTVVAARTADGWGTVGIDRDGGVGVSAFGNGDDLAVAYLDDAGTVKFARPGESPVTVAEGVEAPTPAAAPSPGAPVPVLPAPSTGVAIDGDGVVWVAWGDAQGVRYASSADDFALKDMPAALAGADPHLAMSAEGPRAAWYATGTTALSAAIFTDQEVPFAVPSPAAPIGGGGRPALCEPEGEGVTVTTSAGAAANGFDQDCLAAAAGQPFTVTFTNDDPGVPHNWTLYADDSAQEALGGAGGPTNVITGPDEAVYEIDALEPGQFYFQCDLHTNMNGTFVSVEGDGGSPEPGPSATA
jgi:plastocyanin